MTDLNSAHEGIEQVVKEMEEYIQHLKLGWEDDVPREQLTQTPYSGLQELSFSYFEAPFVELFDEITKKQTK